MISSIQKNLPFLIKRPFVIEKTLGISIGDENYCAREITEAFSFVQLSNGFVLPKQMADDMIIGVADKEKSQKSEEFFAEKRQQQAEAERLRQERLAEKKQKKKEEEQAKIDERQLKLW